MDNLCNNLTSDDQSSGVDYPDLADISPYQLKAYRTRYDYVVTQLLSNHANFLSLGRAPLILDAATGMGAGAAYISEQLRARYLGTPAVYGADLNAEAIAKAKHLYSDYASYLLADIEGAASYRKWDVIVSMETLEHIAAEKAESFIKTAARQLNPGGIFICSSPRRRPRESTVRRPGHINEMFYQEFKYLVGSEFARLEFASMDRYGNLVGDSPDANLMLATCHAPRLTKIFTHS